MDWPADTRFFWTHYRYFFTVIIRCYRVSPHGRHLAKFRLTSLSSTKSTLHDRWLGASPCITTPRYRKKSTVSIIWGVSGTIAQSDRSDLDIWLCHKPGLTREQLGLLQDKCEGISDWAEQQRLEVHIFLMDFEAFKRGRLSSLDKESSGSAQHLLLLDEFYRSAIFIAGRAPLWWYVPEKDETNYRAHAGELIDKRFITPHHVLDFGGVANIPEGEFVGAGIWQLYKAIESPYKSVSKTTFVRGLCL